MKSKNQKPDKPLTYSCSFEECEPAMLERIRKLRYRTILEVAYRNISKYANSIPVAQIPQTGKATV